MEFSTQCVFSLLQVVFGQWAVSLASVFVCGGGSSGNKKQEFRVSFADISKTYHLLHQLSMACKCVCVCVCVCACVRVRVLVRVCVCDMIFCILFSPSATNSSHSRTVEFYLGLNALNFAETDRPFGNLSLQQFAEMYFAQGLQSHLSIPYGGGLFKVYMSCSDVWSS